MKKRIVLDKTTELEQAFYLLNNIEPDDKGCWIWQRSKTKGGYGLLFGKKGIVLTHRLSLQVFKGESPVGGLVLHSCDKPSCINPDHLRIGTARDNIRDMVSRKRHPIVGVLKDVCKNGHKFTPENTRLVTRSGNVVKYCRECARINCSTNYYRHREEYQAKARVRSQKHRDAKSMLDKGKC